MRINTGTNGGAISMSTDMVSAGFNIRANGKAFRILSDSLYQNKQGSIVREICSNAMDSHIAAGTPDLPFEVHLPSGLEPWFSVKDFGVGLSHEQVFGIYTTLFASSKDNANDQVGAFGLGSKTPFSYTDSFTVTSIYNGMKRTYCAMIQGDTLDDGQSNPEAGVPTIILMGEEETVEHNGVEVLININQNDYTTFINETRNQLRFFRVKPTIRNRSDFQFDDVEQLVQFRLTNFNILGKRNNNQYSPSNTYTYIVQGGVGYPLSYEKILAYYSNQDNYKPDMAEFIRAIQNIGAYLFFNIGEIEVTPSREGISYTVNTIQNIAKRFETAREEFYKIAEQEIQALPNDWERAKMLNAGGALLRNAIKLSTTRTFEWDGAGYSYNMAKVVVDKDGKRMMYPCRLEARSAHRLSEHTSDLGFIRCNDHVKFVYLDHCKNVKGRLREDVLNWTRHKLYNGDHRMYYTFQPAAFKDENTDEWKTHYFDDAELKQWADEYLGGAEVVRLSSLPEPERKPRISYGASGERVGYKPPKLYRYIGGAFEKRSNYEQIHDKIKDIVGGTYIVIPEGSRKIVINFDVNIFNKLRQADLIDVNAIYAIRERDAEKIKTNSNWVHIDDMMNQKIAELRKPYRELLRIARKQARWSVSQNQIPHTVNIVCEESNVHALKRFITRFKNIPDLSKYEQLIVEYNDPQVFADLVKKFKDSYNSYRTKIFKKFPLLFAQYRTWGSVIEDEDVKNALVEYVKTV